MTGPEDDQPVIPDRADDDRDVGWGDDEPGRRSRDDELEQDRPPHWE